VDLDDLGLQQLERGVDRGMRERLLSEAAEPSDDAASEET